MNLLSLASEVFELTKPASLQYFINTFVLKTCYLRLLMGRDGQLAEPT